LASRPVNGGDEFWANRGEQALEGAAIGGGLGVAGNMLAGLRNFVTPATVTQAASRLFGENASRLTPELLAAVKQRIGAVMDRIESGHDIKVDNTLLQDLSSVDQKAHDVLGNEAAPVARAIDGILSRADQNGVISGKSAASTWHRGSLLDNLTESRNPDIAGFAQQAQNAMRGALNRQLPAAEAQACSQARAQYRDLKIVEKALRPGEERLSPSRFASQVNRRFPGMASQPSPPPVAQLARATGETFGHGGRYGGGAIGGLVGALIGETLAHGIGAGIGAVGGSVVGHAVLGRLAELRYARGNALRALRTPPGAAVNAMALSVMPRRCWCRR
jgi:hypothetical protein